MPTPFYQVGYKKPPVHSRFKPGQSGNKKGRTKKISNLSDIVLEELNELQTIDKNGTRIRMSMERIISKQLVRAAAKVNIPALKLVIEMREQGLSRKAKADYEALRAKLFPKDLSTLSQAELTNLYFETLNRGRHE